MPPEQLVEVFSGVNMNSIELSCVQYSDEWWDARKGRFTASQANKIITPTGKASSQFNGEVGRLIAEEMGLQDPKDFAGTEWMQRGSELEDEARDWLSFQLGEVVRPCGIFLKGGRFAASPDGVMVAHDGSKPVEIKVPKPSTHISWLLAGVLPPEHKPQIHMQLAVTGADTAYFMSYNPDIKPLVVVVNRDEYTEALQGYMDEVEKVYDRSIKMIGDTQCQK
jgi:putative phage-type endonuclease